MIPYSRQSINEQDIEEVIKVLRSDLITQGPINKKFEEEICSYTGCKYSVVTNSATSALHLACLALGLGPGDTLWTSPNSYVASANVGLLCNAEVDFVDIDSKTYNMCVKSLDQKLRKAEADGKLPKIVMPVHFAGQSCDMISIKKLAEKYGFKIVEDASHAIGGRYNGEPIGSCSFSDIVVFSFHPVKIITTGEGGSALTNDLLLLERLRLMCSHGVTRDPSKMVTKSGDAWVYDQISLGFNFRMSDLNAALGLSQLKRIDQFIRKRNEIAKRYDEELSQLNLKIPFRDFANPSSLHLYPIQTKQRGRVFDLCHKEGIKVNVHYKPIHIQPFWQNKGFLPGDHPNSEAYYSKAISLPIHPELSDEQQEKVIKVLKSI